MFKNVTNALKFKNQLLEARDRKKHNINEAPAMLSDELLDKQHQHLMALKTDSENFLVRQSRKKLASLLDRLQRVKKLSKKAKKQRITFEGQEPQGDTPNKPEFIIQHQHREGLTRYARKQSREEPCDSDDDDDQDEDEDDAYVSASESLCDSSDEEEEEDRDSDLEQAGSSTSTTRRRDAEEDLQQLEDSFEETTPEEQCDIPTFLHTKNAHPHLIEETRRYLRERHAQSPDALYEADYQRMLTDDWTVTRFLLRRRLDPKRTAKLMEDSGRFRREHMMGQVKLWEFPAEFHIAGGLFQYAPDRVGNVTMYMRIKMYRRVAEIDRVFKAFILCVLEQCDRANSGRGLAVVFDLTGCGLQNVDLVFLYFLLSSFRNYCPKGLSYILVYNLPWFLSATAKLALSWLSATNRRALRFIQGKEIEHFIAPENLPDYLGGTCPIDYHAIPEGSRLAVDVCERLNITKEQALKIKELFKDCLPKDYESLVPPVDEALFQFTPIPQVGGANPAASGGGGGGTTQVKRQSHDELSDSARQVHSKLTCGTNANSTRIPQASQATRIDQLA